MAKKWLAPKPESFTEQPGVVEAVAYARGLIADGRTVSDIVDDAGFQYVDLVMEGGGVLGIALVGYTYVLESAGIRFLGIGGTSAGAINAMLLAAMGPPAEPKSERVLAALCAKNLYELVDGDSDARDFVDALVDNRGTVTKAFKLLQVLDTLNDSLGLNPGEDFRKWISSLLSASGVSTIAALAARLAILPPGLQTRAGVRLSVEKAKSMLAIVAADVTTETKVEFPRMAPLYFSNPEAVDPAVLVRASMSIPYFFEPLSLGELPRTPDRLDHWRTWAGIDLPSVDRIPERVLFVDGGVMSNFPINLFHEDGVPDAPTFGARLGRTARRNVVEGPLQLFGAAFNAARHCLDYDFIVKNRDYRHLVEEIPVDQFNWLDFRMAVEEQRKLFLVGAESAAQFVSRFDWDAYKRLRQGLSAAAIGQPNE